MQLATNQKLIIIDSHINNWQSLADNVSPGTLVLILDSSTDGLTQISDYLTTLSANADAQSFLPLQSIHIISHGSEGSLLLGSTTLTGSNLNAYSKQLATLGNALTEKGDILLYGCNVAADQTGLQFINQLADLTHADVTASNDITGSAVLGGDWQLEAATGTIESSLALSATTLNTYSDTLAINYAAGIVATDFNYEASVALQADGKIVMNGANSNENSVLVLYNSDGSVDTGFDSDGKVTTNYYNASVVLQADGKILMRGSNDDGSTVLVRYNSNGSLDTSFDSDGKLPSNGYYSYSVALQTDGKILVRGYNDNGKFVLVRYNSDGSLDTSFDSDGKITASYYDASVVLQADGKILMNGADDNENSVLVRYNSDGSLDTGLDSDGIVSTGFNYVDSVVLQADGKILMSGGGSDGKYVLARYNTNGSLDTSFDSDGKVTPTYTYRSFTLQADGKILMSVASNAIYSFGLVRYNTNGSLDTSFDSDGIVTTGLQYNSLVTLQADGKILVSGGDGSSSILARYNSDGSLDTSFDGDGKVTANLDGMYKTSVIVQADDKILLSGTDPTNYGIVLARYNSDGSLDTGFGTSANTGSGASSDITAPTITTFSPTDEAASVGVSDNIVLTFDEAIQKGKGSIVLMTSAGKSVEAFNIATSTAVSISGDTLTINPSRDLSYDTGYKLKIVSGAITDTANNKYTADLTSYNFTTTDTLTTSEETYTLATKGPKKLIYSGTGDFTGTGNKSANEITGDVGDDMLNGGLGNDTLTGGDGADRFIFNTKAGKTNIDTITDFTTGTDQIFLSSSIFKKMLPFTLTADQLVIGTAALDSNDYLVYNSASGSLFYDADGSGRGKAVEIAVIGTDLNLTVDDFA